MASRTDTDDYLSLLGGVLSKDLESAMKLHNQQEFQRREERWWKEWAEGEGKEVVKVTFNPVLLTHAFYAGVRAKGMSLIEDYLQPTVAWMGPDGQLLPDEIYQAWAAQYPEQASRYTPLRRK